MKAWIVYEDYSDYDCRDTTVLKVFDSEKKADDFVKKIIAYVETMAKRQLLYAPDEVREFKFGSPEYQAYLDKLDAAEKKIYEGIPKEYCHYLNDNYTREGLKIAEKNPRYAYLYSQFNPEYTIRYEGTEVE